MPKLKLRSSVWLSKGSGVQAMVKMLVTFLQHFSPVFNIWITWGKWEVVVRHAKMLSTPHMLYWPSGRTSGLIRPSTRLISIHHYWTSLVNKVFILKKKYSLQQESRMPTIMACARLSFLGFDWSLSLFILWFHCQLTGFHLTNGHC